MNVYFDTETTSLSPGQICQLSYIMEDGERLTAKNFFFAVDFVSPSAFAVHGFSKARLDVLSDGLRFSDHAEEIYNDFEKSTLYAHNFPFDLSFMQAEFERAGAQFRYLSSVCTMRKFTTVCKLPRANGMGYKYPKLSELTAFFELSSHKIDAATEFLFDCDAAFHDARFDTAGMFLACATARKMGITI